MLALAARLDEGRPRAAADRTRHDRADEITIGAMRHVLSALSDSELELEPVRFEAYRRALFLNDETFRHFDAAALAVERIRRAAMRAPALA
ncbi:hypothetical protein [Methylocella sp.]|uniref:hypothetical protein n=1 Tax=Methylocella sp. TaxID=1978226 RepID=UPI0035B14777